MIARIVIICLTFCSVLMAQNKTVFEDSKQALLIIKNNIQSVKTYSYQTSLQDSFKTEEVLVSTSDISKSKKGTLIKTLQFHPKKRLNIVEEYEEYYNKDLQRVWDMDKTNGYISNCAYEYNKEGLLIKEISIWSYDYSKHYDTTLYIYGEDQKLIYSEKLSNTGHWARDSFFYEGGNLIKKIHQIRIDTNPSITFEEEHIVNYFYESTSLVISNCTFHYTDKFRIDSTFYENGEPVKNISWDCESPTFCDSRIEYVYDHNGNVTKMIADLYPEETRLEFYNLYDDRGLLISSVTINHSVGRKFFMRYIYE